MAFAYKKYQESAHDPAISLTGTLSVLFVDNTYTPINTSANEFLSDIGASSRTSNGVVALANATYTDGVLDADDLVIASFPSGKDVYAIVVIYDTGVEATSRLVGFVDNFTWGVGASAPPFTPNTGGITIQWDVSGIIKFNNI